MDYYVVMDRIERRIMQEEGKELRQAEAEIKKKKLSASDRAFLWNFNESKKHIAKIHEALGDDFNRKPEDFVNSKQDIREVSKIIIRELEAISGIIEDIAEDLEKRVEKGGYSRKDFAFFKKDVISKFLEKNKAYIKYWEVIKNRKGLPNFLNKFFRGKEFREFDETSVEARVYTLVLILKEFHRIFQKSG
jgi:hypothetical protein